MNTEIRSYDPADCCTLARLFHDTVHTVNAADYTPEQLDAWATDVIMGVRYNVQLPSLGSAPAGLFTVQTGAIGSVGDVNPAVKMSYDGYSYRQECAQRDRWGWEIGCGVDVPVSNTVSLFGAAEAIIRDASHSLDAQVGVRVAF